jgi:hypothetical protein
MDGKPTLSLDNNSKKIGVWFSNIV